MQPFVLIFKSCCLRDGHKMNPVSIDFFLDVLWNGCIQVQCTFLSHLPLHIDQEHIIELRNSTIYADNRH